MAILDTPVLRLCRTGSTAIVACASQQPAKDLGRARPALKRNPLRLSCRISAGSATGSAANGLVRAVVAGNSHGPARTFVWARRRAARHSDQPPKPRSSLMYGERAPAGRIRPAPPRVARDQWNNGASNTCLAARAQRSAATITRGVRACSTPMPRLLRPFAAAILHSFGSKFRFSASASRLTFAV